MLFNLNAGPDMLSAAGTALIAFLLLGACALILALRRNGHEPSMPPAAGGAEPAKFDLDRPEPSRQELYLLCPHCQFEGPLDDARLVGQTVDCPVCEQSFVVLEPDCALTDSAGVK